MKPSMLHVGDVRRRLIRTSPSGDTATPSTSPMSPRPIAVPAATLHGSWMSFRRSRISPSSAALRPSGMDGFALLLDAVGHGDRRVGLGQLLAAAVELVALDALLQRVDVEAVQAGVG